MTKRPYNQEKIKKIFQQSAIFFKNKEYNKSIDLLKKILKYSPSNLPALNLLGAVHFETNHFDDSEKIFFKGLNISPNDFMTLKNLAHLMEKKGEYFEAQKYYKKILSSSTVPINWKEKIFNNLGNVYYNLNNLTEAKSYYLEAIKENNNYSEAYNHLGFIHKEQQNFSEAAKCFKKALQINSNFSEAQVNYSLMLLLLEDFKEGWKKYEWRFEKKNAVALKRNFPQPFWNNENLESKSLLIWGEQGIGDEIMFSKIFLDFKLKNTSINVECDKRLVPLFRRSFKNIIFYEKSNPPNTKLLSEKISFQLGIGSLGKFFRNRIEDFPSLTQYLLPNNEKVAKLRKKYKQISDNKILVGISWKSGNKQFGKKRSIELKLWEKIILNKNFFFVNLQYGEVVNEINEFKNIYKKEIFHDKEINSLKSIDDFAAQIAALDLVISVDNSTAHLSGALGKKTWTLLPNTPEWRWSMKREYSLWYPKMRLFRQNRNGSWQDVFDRIDKTLKKLFK